MLSKNPFPNLNLLSVIVPTFNQGKTIVRNIVKLEKVLKKLNCEYEIIVVVDGLKNAADKTYKNAKKLRSDHIKVISYKKNQGKGHAIRLGMQKSQGEIVGFIDADMDIHPSGFFMLLNHMEWYNADVIIGSKLHPVSKVIYPFDRRILSWGYRLLTRILFGLKVRDTQVGLKFFKRRVIQDVIPRLLVKTYAFDIEVLAIAYHLGYKRIYEAPVEIYFSNKSSITSKNLWRVILLMLKDTLAVFFRLRLYGYFSTKKGH